MTGQTAVSGERMGFIPMHSSSGPGVDRLRKEESISINHRSPMWNRTRNPSQEPLHLSAPLLVRAESWRSTAAHCTPGLRNMN